MVNLPGNIGDSSIEELIALAKSARDAAKAAIDAAAKALADNPQLQGIIEQIQQLLGNPPAVHMTDAEMSDLIASWNKGNTAKSKPFPTAPPPPTSGFPYMEVLTVHPLAHARANLLKRGNEMFTTSVPIGEQPGPHYMVWNGVADKPNPIWPPPGGWSPIGVI